jgi:hypothetical protein
MALALAEDEVEATLRAEPVFEVGDFGFHLVLIFSTSLKPD